MSFVGVIDGTDAHGDPALAAILRWHITNVSPVQTTTRDQVSEVVLELAERLKPALGSPMLTPWFRDEANPLHCMTQTLKGLNHKVTREEYLTPQRVAVLDRVLGVWDHVDDIGPDGYTTLLKSQIRL